MMPRSLLANVRAMSSMLTRDTPCGSTHPYYLGLCLLIFEYNKDDDSPAAAPYGPYGADSAEESPPMSETSAPSR